MRRRIIAALTYLSFLRPKTTHVSRYSSTPLCAFLVTGLGCTVRVCQYYCRGKVCRERSGVRVLDNLHEFGVRSYGGRVLDLVNGTTNAFELV